MKKGNYVLNDIMAEVEVNHIKIKDSEKDAAVLNEKVHGSVQSDPSTD